MEALTALSLASSIVQFVSFASDLISKSSEIYSSAKGGGDHILALETVYEHLPDLGLGLEASSRRDPKLDSLDEKPDIVKRIFAINDLSRSCKEDCDKLSKVVSTLRGGNRVKSRWQSFRVALKTIWKGKEIADLEQRLQRSQATLTLEVCAVTSYWQGVYLRQLDSLRLKSQNLHSRQFTKLDSIQKSVDELATHVTRDKSRPIKAVMPADIEFIQEQMRQLNLSKSLVRKEHVIIRSLGFDSRSARFSAIPENYETTFGWALSELSNRSRGLSADNLLPWLEHGTGFFWVSGKPGSGKSTFMKFLAGHPRTRQALSNWADPGSAIIVSHYFWTAGTSMQKSLQGLLQTVLSEIFRQLPELIEPTCIERWAKSEQQLSHEVWHVPELQKALQRIARRDNLSAKICLFIDGLDEYEGDHLDFCQAIQDLSNSSHIKLCISSRPWNIFEDSFGKDVASKIYMQDLIQGDIRSYAAHRLKGHPKWPEVNANFEEAEYLVDQITERACGVFLWVYLTTRELRKGLSEYDSLSDLRRRLESIPDDLEEFFTQILESVDPFYHEKMSTTLQLSLIALEPLPVAIYGFHDLEYENEGYASELPTKAIDKQQAASRQTQTIRRLNGRCRGLLEANRQSGCVEFIHRTLVDFLKTREMSDYLERKAARTFNAHLSLLRAFTTYIKTTKFSEFVDRTGFAQHTNSKFMSSLEQALAYAREIEEDVSVSKLLYQLEQCVYKAHKNGQVTLNVWGDPRNPVCVFFREAVLNALLVCYVRHVLTIDPHYFSFLEKPAEYFVINDLPRSVDDVRRAHMLQCLAEHSYALNSLHYDPTTNESRSAWVTLLDESLPDNSFASDQVSRFHWLLQKGLFSTIKHGADPNACSGPNVWPCLLRGRVAWMTFASAAINTTFNYFHRTLFIQVLDEFFDAGAALQEPSLTKFINACAQSVNSENRTPRADMLGEVMERLLSRAKAINIDIDRHWPILKLSFHPQILVRLRSSVWHDDVDNMRKTLSTAFPTVKRSREFGDQIIEQNNKRVK